MTKMRNQPKVDCRVRITIDIPSQFASRCEFAEISPKEVLEAFIRDLCALDGSNGSDERDLAQSYFDRCGYDRRAFMAFS